MNQFRQKQAAIVAVTVLLLNTAGRMLWQYCGCLWSYDLFDAIAWVIIIGFLSLVTTGNYKTIIQAVGLLAAANLIDELFFEKGRLGANEVIFVVLIMCWAGNKIIKRNRNER